MAKMSRTQLKSLIKECLVEVLIDGLNPGSGEDFLQEAKSRKTRTSKDRAAPRTRRPALDNVRFDQKINDSVSACTEDPILGNILADTARTTLQEQISNDSSNISHNHQVSMNGDPAAQMAAKNDPSDMFGEASNNWATLAFGKV